MRPLYYYQYNETLKHVSCGKCGTKDGPMYPMRSLGNTVMFCDSCLAEVYNLLTGGTYDGDLEDFVPIVEEEMAQELCFPPNRTMWFEKHRISVCQCTALIAEIWREDFLNGCNQNGNRVRIGGDI